MEILEKIKPQTEGQKKLLVALMDEDNQIVGVFGPTGTGKSLIILTYSIQEVLAGKYKRIIICRPIVDITTGKELTALELGDLYFDIQKRYIEDIFAGFDVEIDDLIKEGKIAFVDTRYIRGRTFDNSIIFLDDIQSMTPETVLELVIRTGKNSRLFVAGDPILQRTADGIRIIREILLSEENSKVVDLGIKDVVRPGAKRGLRLYFEMLLRKRELNDVESNILSSIKIHAPNADVLTVIDVSDLKEALKITEKNVPDAIIIVKRGTLGKLIGREGENINKIESEVKMKLRGVEFDLDFVKLIESIHPVRGIARQIADVDFAGPELCIKVRNRYGRLTGDGGRYIKLVDAFFRKLFGVGARAIPPEEWM